MFITDIRISESRKHVQLFNYQIKEISSSFEYTTPIQTHTHTHIMYIYISYILSRTYEINKRICKNLLYYKKCMFADYLKIKIKSILKITKLTQDIGYNGKLSRNRTYLLENIESKPIKRFRHVLLK